MCDGQEICRIGDMSVCIDSSVSKSNEGAPSTAVDESTKVLLSYKTGDVAMDLLHFIVKFSKPYHSIEMQIFLWYLFGAKLDVKVR